MHLLFCANFIFFTFLTNVELRHFQAVFIPFYSKFVLWLFTHWHLMLYFWVFNLEIVKSPTVDYIVKFGCNLISFLYIWTLQIDCSHTDVHQRRRSRAEFCLVLLWFRPRLFIDALWSPAGKGLISWLLFAMSNCEVVTFPLVSWISCGAWLYRFLVFALFLMPMK